MSKNFKQFLVLTIQSVIFWIMAFLLYAIFRFYGIGEMSNYLMIVESDIHVALWVEITVYVGLLLGLCYALIEFIFEKYVINRYSLGITLIFKTVLYLLVLIIVISLATVYTEELMDIDLANDKGWWRTNKTFWATVLYFFMSSLVFSFIKISNEKFGRGVFLKMLLGTYRKPKEEERIFMFLDLKDSTSIAEDLGHFKYSEFIQDCFIDLNRVLEKFDAEVYQYVGDEAVLSWSYKRGLYKNKCVDLFFAFQSQINKRSNYYQRKYSFIPIFKAGLHGGKLMIAEVGTIKKELAFHGDVINTTSRIQSECNNYNQSLLISEKLLEDLNLSSVYNINALGDIQFKGKHERINVFSIS